MISRTYLIARREYLSYVATWGFWISLSIAPLFVAAGVIAPTLLERASPVRHVTVIAEEPALYEAVADELEARARASARRVLSSYLRTRADEDAQDVALRAFDATPGAPRAALRAGLDAAGENVDAAFQVMPIEAPKIVLVPSPEEDAEALRPYLMGERLTAAPGGPQPLDAAAVLRRNADGVVEADLWSTNLAFAQNEFRTLIGGAARNFMRREALSGAGVAPDALIELEQLSPRINELTPEREGVSAQVTLADRLPYAVGFGLGISLWLVIFSVVNMLLTSTIEEKSNKILDMLLASARLHEILFGKLLGVAAVSFTLMAAWAFAGGGLLLFAAGNGGGVPAAVFQALADPGLLIPFAAYFVAGYILYGAIFAAIGSLCETNQEAQTLMSPIIVLLLVPMFVMPVAMRDPDSSVLAVISWIPLYTPFLMMLRLPADPPLYEVVGTAVLLIATTGFVLWAAGHVFRAGVVGRLGVGRLGSSIKALWRRPAG